MGVTVTKTGSGTLGELKPGWSVNEFATPVNPAESAGGTGTVTYGGRDGTESLMLIGDEATFTSTDLGSISGVMRNVSQSGLNVDITQDNKLARFDASMNIPPVIAASVPCALDLADQLTGTVRLSQPDGIFWSLAGHLAGFDPEGLKVPFSQERTSYTYYSPALTEYVTVDVTAITDSLWSSQFATVGLDVFSTYTTGDSFVPKFAAVAPGVVSVGATRPYVANQVSFKTVLDGGDVTFSLQGQPNIGATQGSGQLLTFVIDYSAETLTLNAEYWSGGMLVNTSDVQSISTLDLDAELAVFFMFRPWQGSSFENEYKPIVVVCNTSDYSTTLDASINYASDGRDSYFDPWEIAGNVRAVWRKDFTYYSIDSMTLLDNFVPTVAEYEVSANFTYTETPALGTPSLGVNDNLWAWLQDSCSAYKWEIAVEGDQIVTRPIGGTVLNVDNYSPTPSVNPALTFTGRQVNVNYSQSEAVFEGEVYDARSDDNRIISVNAAQSTTLTVAANVYLFSAINPVRVTTFIPGEGTYYVIDSTGLPIVAEQWEDYGGSVSVAPSANNPSGIDITVTGPREEIPSTTGPYSLAVSDGENQYAALSIFGSGLVYEPKILPLLTGADPARTSQQVATTIDNPFLSTVEQAYDTGIWASIDASGPTVSLTFSVPTSSIASFGVTPGALVEWQSLQYRVVSSRITNLSADLTCVRHVTVEDFDNLWNGFSVGYHDDLWDTYQAKDQIVYTLKQPPIFDGGDGFGLEPFGVTPFGTS